MRVMIGGLALDLTDDQVADLWEQLSVEPERRTVTGDSGLLTTAQAAEWLGFSADYVRDHAAELGGRKMGAGPKAQWRFDPAKLGAGAPEDATDRDRTPARRRPARRPGSERQLLKARG